MSRNDDFFAADAMLVRAPFDNLTIIRANQHLAPFNTPCPEDSGMTQCARQSLLAVLHGYDLVRSTAMVAVTMESQEHNDPVVVGLLRRQGVCK